MRGLLGFALVLAACGGPAVGPSSTAVGATCANNGQCQQVCIMSDHFPGGLCSETCSSDGSCPGGSACVSHNGQSFCAPSCSTTSDCSSYGRGFVCDSEDHAGGGTVTICRAH